MATMALCPLWRGDSVIRFSVYLPVSENPVATLALRSAGTRNRIAAWIVCGYPDTRADGACPARGYGTRSDFAEIRFSGDFDIHSGDHTYHPSFDYCRSR